MRRKAALHNLGCKVNAYETQAMEESLKKAGYEIVSFNEEADVYIINTCTVTNIADRKSRQMLHRAGKRNPHAVIVAAGCYVETSDKEIDPVIDVVIGNNKKHDIVGILDSYYKSGYNEKQDEIKNNVGKTVLEVKADIGKADEYEEMELGTVTDHVRANIKIQDGCNQFCSYCIIPYARGRIRSRNPQNVIAEVERLSLAGYKEVVLTGIHLSSYGKDIGESIVQLITDINKVTGIERIRLGSLEPGIIDDEFVRELSKLEKFCPHFHLSLQSGCDATLKRMNRHYTSKEYMEACNIIRQYFDSPAITTDIIVGFPGETKEEFESSMRFVKSVNFYETHIFKYSRRAGTRAAEMENQIPENIKNDRSNKLITLGKAAMKSYEEKIVGQTREVLIEEAVCKDGEMYQVGHTKEYVKVGIKSDKDLINKLVDVYIMNYLQIFH